MTRKKHSILKRIAVSFLASVLCLCSLPALPQGFLSEPIIASAASNIQIYKGYSTFTYQYTADKNTTCTLSNTTIATVSSTVSGTKRTYTITCRQPNTNRYVRTFAAYIKSGGTVIKTLTFNQSYPIVTLNKTSETVPCFSSTEPGGKTISVKVTTNANVGISRISPDAHVKDSISPASINGYTEDGSTKSYTVKIQVRRNDGAARYEYYLFQCMSGYETFRIYQDANAGFTFSSSKLKMTGPRPTITAMTADYTVAEFSLNAANMDGFSNSSLSETAINNGIRIVYSGTTSPHPDDEKNGYYYTGNMQVKKGNVWVSYGIVYFDIYGKQIDIYPHGYAFGGGSKEKLRSSLGCVLTR